MIDLSDYMGNRREGAPAPTGDDEKGDPDFYSFRDWLRGPSGAQMLRRYGEGEDVEIDFRGSGADGTVNRTSVIVSDFEPLDDDDVGDGGEWLDFGQRVREVADVFETRQKAADSLGISKSYLYDLFQRRDPPSRGSVPATVRARERYYGVGQQRERKRGEIKTPNWRPQPGDIEDAFLREYWREVRLMFEEHGSKIALSVG